MLIGLFVQRVLKVVVFICRQIFKSVTLLTMLTGFTVTVTVGGIRRFGRILHCTIHSYIDNHYRYSVKLPRWVSIWDLTGSVTNVHFRSLPSYVMYQGTQDVLQQALVCN